ncbi:STAS domain-containing protein [Planctomyces sp. SH-PL14]|uniref:STAS domain-containing protein n=1 Tax=Planctomyces sp. SH-PL14 TaxID=1632864 RepID=UPI00078C5A42|nr:STAS domain-containing protein [Planctomyces sp. SH-PL14]AMV16958.1 RsbT co-antagonist protein RsbRA [Planctomyces sp. SH-PL14]
MAKAVGRIADTIKKHEDSLISDWMRLLREGGSGRDNRINESDLKTQAGEFVSLLQKATQSGDITDTTRPEWKEIEGFLAEVSRTRVLQGFTVDETARFVFSFKQPLFARLKTDLAKDAEAFTEETWVATELLDKMGLLTVRAFQKTREDVIRRQQQDLLELSTPVVKLWDGILALPMIGTLDSERTQIVMESLLQRVVETGSEIAILDITGVPTVDTLVAQHLLKTVTALQLMGAECIISGVRPQIAQTIVHLGIDLGGVITKATLADALELAMKRLQLVVTKRS